MNGHEILKFEIKSELEKTNKQNESLPDRNFIDMQTALDNFAIKIMELINETYEMGTYQEISIGASLYECLRK